MRMGQNWKNFWNHLTHNQNLKNKTYPTNYQLQCPNGWKFDPLLVAICGGNHVWLSCWYIQTIEFGWLQELVPQLTLCYLSPMPRENNIEKLIVAKFQVYPPILKVVQEINKQIKTVFVAFVKIQRYQGKQFEFRFPFLSYDKVQIF